MHVGMQRVTLECVQVNAEIIVTFEGVTEFGNDFMSRQSYLPHELRWGHHFKNMLSHPQPGSSQYQIDFSGSVQCCLLLFGSCNGFSVLHRSVHCLRAANVDI